MCGKADAWRAESACSAPSILDAGSGKRGGEILKTRIQFVVMFAAGVVLGALAHAWLTAPPKNSASQGWMSTYNEEKVQAMMLQFQNKLKELESAGPANAAELSKEVEIQSGILDLISKYREAEYAKYAPFTGLAGVLFAAILGALAPKLLGRRNSQTGPTP
jgi:hypothetical protein